MKPTLQFKTDEFRVAPLGPESSTPDLIPGSNFQNKTNFYLDEDDEIYEGYGKLLTSYPYRQYTCYTRDCQKTSLKTAILENDFLIATFLPEFGGRLWSLIDKKTNTNLLYTNDVIRPSNLAIRNAWFSGGVEWNISMIGHTPFTFDPLYTAEASLSDGTPVLRMYEYERVRKVTYQMDFWLTEDSPFLNCRMRIYNQTTEVIPMYWWSNMAVPEYENGRIVVPAAEAYSNCEDGVYKASIPFVNNVDVTKYCDIPNQVDYFFNIPKDEPKYIANFNSDGYGLLHVSTSRLQSRKLFTWGQNDASNRWQEFLTDDAGKYVEIQAGLGKTQYGCIPMAPNTSWEWMEHYGAIQTDASITTKPYEEAVTEITEIVNTHLADYRLEAYLKETRPMAKTEGKLLYHGSGYGAFANALRNHNGEKTLSPQLIFTDELGTYDTWKAFLETGILNTPDINEKPNDFVCDNTLHQLLCNTISNKNAGNWYAHYQLGLSYYQKENHSAAKAELLASYNCVHNPWALHGLAAFALRNGNKSEASAYILEGYSFRKEDLSYLKETWKILLLAEAYDKMLALYETLPENFRNESRIYYGYLVALGRTGQEKEAFEILTGDSPLELVDLRECEDTLGALYKELHKKIYGTEGTVPHMYNFYSL